MSELKWTGVANLTQMIIISTTVGKKSLRRNGVAIIVNKKVKNTVFGCNLKNDSVCFQGKPFNTTVIQVYALTNNAEEADVEWFYENLQDLLELTPNKYVLYIIGPGTQK